MHSSRIYAFIPLPSSTQALHWVLGRKDETNSSRYRKHGAAEQTSQRGGCRAVGGPKKVPDLVKQVRVGQRRHFVQKHRVRGSRTHPEVNGGQLKEGWRLRPLGLLSQNKVPEAGWLIRSRSLFLMVLGAGKSTIVAPAGSGAGGSPLPGLQKADCILSGWLLWGLCYEGTTPIVGLCNHLPYARPLIPSPWALGFNVGILGGLNIQPTAVGELDTGPCQPEE